MFRHAISDVLLWVAGGLQPVPWGLWNRQSAFPSDPRAWNSSMVTKLAHAADPRLSQTSAFYLRAGARNAVVFVNVSVGNKWVN